MTRDEISDLVTKIVGQVDATSLALCNTFVQRAYEMVWNADLWRDTVTIDLTGTIAQGVNTLNLPSGFERVISLQLLSGGVPVGFLDPTTSTFILQAEPTALTSQGVPTKYEEFVHTDGTKKIRVFPLPNAAYTFTLSGKRTCPTLGASDTLQIRNVDNAVIALATVQMYKRLRQFGKAAEAAKEAGAYIEEAKAIEHSQSNQPRTSKQLTVAGNTLAEMADAVSARTGQWSPDASILIKDFLRRNYQQVYDSTLWTESTVVIDVASVLGQLVLPEYIDRVISIRGTASLGQLSAVQPSLYFGVSPQIFEQTAGDPLAFSYLTPVATQVQPGGGSEQIKLVSNSTADKSPVFIRGEDNVGAVINESVNLNGTTTVTTVLSFNKILTLSKGITAGIVTASGNTSLVTFVALAANERERKHIRIWLQPTPTANVTCKVLGKRRITPLIQDEDSPLLRDIGNVLINLACSDMFSKIGNDKASADARSKAGEALATLIDLEKSQGANSWQVVPDVEPMYLDYADDWLVAK